MSSNEEDLFASPGNSLSNNGQGSALEEEGEGTEVLEEKVEKETRSQVALGKSMVDVVIPGGLNAFTAGHSWRSCIECFLKIC
jgi:hypothetical protein